MKLVAKILLVPVVALALLVLALPLFLLSIVLAFAPNRAVSISSVKSKYPNSKFVRLEDGRVLEYQIGGAGTMLKPVVATHGFAQTSGMFLMAFQNEIYKKLGLDVISVTQPGFGYSDSFNRFFPRDVKDWGKDVEAVLRAENIDKFYVMGTSAGGMHALSLVDKFPDRVKGGAIIAPSCPTDVEKEIGADRTIATATKVIRKSMAMRFIGDLLAFLFSKISAQERFNAAPDVKAALIKLRAEGKGALCDEFLRDSERSTLHTFRGWTDNMRTLNNWTSSTLDLEKLDHKLVVAFAEDDTTNPPAMQKWVHSKLKNSILLKIDDGYGHLFSLVGENFEKILRTMMELANDAGEQ